MFFRPISSYHRFLQQSTTLFSSIFRGINTNKMIQFIYFTTINAFCICQFGTLLDPETLTTSATGSARNFHRTSTKLRIPNMHRSVYINLSNLRNIITDFDAILRPHAHRPAENGSKVHTWRGHDPFKFRDERGTFEDPKSLIYPIKLTDRSR